MAPAPMSPAPSAQTDSAQTDSAQTEPPDRLLHALGAGAHTGSASDAERGGALLALRHDPKRIVLADVPEEALER